MADKAKYAQWAALLEAAEAAQGIPLIPHNDLPDALAAYRHFLYGRGADRTISYERYVASDRSGKITLDNAILDLRRGVEELADGLAVGAAPSFSVSSGPIPCGSSDPDLADLSPILRPRTGRRRSALTSSGSVVPPGTRRWPVDGTMWC